jgi:RNA polymerase sigma-70 factor (ECF subfamily)
MMMPMEKSDNELVQAYKNGDQSAIEALVVRHLPAVYNFVRRFADEEQAKDIAQETFVKVWKYIKHYDETRNFRVWLFTIAKRAAIDFTRKRKHTPFSAFEEDGERFDVEDLSPLPDELFRKEEIAEALGNLVDELPVDRKAIVILHDAEMLSFADIALIMERPMNTVKSQYRRALIWLRGRIDDGDAPKL